MDLPSMTFEKLPNIEIFVFGSNKAGRHGAGSALHARRHHGAIYGQGVGLQGESYAIPTKDENLNVLSIEEIKTYVNDFILFALNHQECKFKIVRIGCGLAGYTNEQMAPLFKNCSPNCILPKEWIPIIRNENV